jgi:hypothetical protein
VKAGAGSEGEGVELIRIIEPAEHEGVHIGGDVHDVEDHGLGFGDDRDGTELAFERLVDGGVHEVLVDDGDVGSAGGVKLLPFVLEGAGETDEGDECADGHADADERQQRF